MSYNITTMKDRIAEILNREGFTAVKFAEIMEVQPSSVSHLLSGRNKPNYDFIARLVSRFPQYSPDWLINGQGSVYRGDAPSTHVIHQENANGTVTNVTPNLFQKIESFNDEVTDEKEQLVSNIQDIIEQVTDVTSPKIENLASSKTVSRIVLFFDDSTFEIYYNK